MGTLNFNEAFELLIKAAKPKNETLIVPISAALGRVLSDDVKANRDLPPYNNSALDGYAVRYADRGKKLRICPTTIFAGVNLEACLGENECYKIMTGAKIPDDADTIVRFEDTSEENGYVQIPTDIKENEGFRQKGEEYKKNAPLIDKGTRLNHAHIALLAAQGISYIGVRAKPKICVLSSGNELKEPYQSANENELYNINSYAMAALLSQFGFESDYGGIIPDDLDATVRFFGDLRDYDVILTSGGVSVGEADFTTKALEKNGFNALFTKINLKPGKPTTCGTMGKTLVLSMPGNPLSAVINAFLFAIPSLRKIEGEQNFTHKSFTAHNREPFKLKDSRANVVLGTLENGVFTVTDKGKISSGQILPLSKSNAISIVTSGKSLVDSGEKLEVYALF